MKKIIFVLSLIISHFGFSQTAELNRNSQSAISFLPNNGNSIFHISHGLNNDLNISHGTNVGAVNIMTIKNNGYIGIGTSTPTSHFSAGSLINLKSTGNSEIVLDHSDGGTSSDIGIISFERNNDHLAHIKATHDNSTSSAFLSFHTQPTGGDFFNLNSHERMRITSNGNVGIGTTHPYNKLHVNGNVGIGLLSGTYIEGLSIDYVDGGSGTTTFKNNRWGGDIIFKRNSAQGERTQFLFGGAGEHRMEIYNSNNEVKVLFNSGGYSYLNGGNVGIGTTNPSVWRLAVNGKIRAKEIKVETGWSDFVFEKEYKLPTLEEVENHIKENGHLKDIPSAEEVKENGIFLGDMDSKLLQKIEELTLYTINQEKRIETLESNNKEIIALLEKLINKNSEK